MWGKQPGLRSTRAWLSKVSGCSRPTCWRASFGVAAFANTQPWEDNMAKKAQFESQDQEQSPAAVKPARPAFALTALVRYLRIYAALWKNSVIREMSFKSNF